MRKDDRSRVHVFLILLIGIAMAIFSIASIVSFGLNFNCVLLLVLTLLIIYLFMILILVRSRRKVVDADLQLIKQSIDDPFIKGIFIDNVEEDNKDLAPKGVSPIEEAGDKEVEEEEDYSMKYVGNKDNKKYHLINCRFAEGIKDDSRVESIDRGFFSRKKYMACGVCKPNKK